MPKMNVNAFLQMDYENEPPSGQKKQTQFKPCPERSRMGQFQKSQNESKRFLSVGDNGGKARD
jgi:hypothetical protein